MKTAIILIVWIVVCSYWEDYVNASVKKSKNHNRVALIWIIVGSILAIVVGSLVILVNP